MHELPSNSTQETGGPRRWFVIMVGLLCFVAGALITRGFFPAEVARTVVVEKEKRVEVPVDRIIEKRVEVPVEKVVERVVERRVEVPVAADARVPVVASQAADAKVGKKSAAEPIAGKAGWNKLSLGMTQAQVDGLLGKPQKVEGRDYAVWWYGGMRVSFAHGKVCHWGESAR